MEFVFIVVCTIGTHVLAEPALEVHLLQTGIGTSVMSTSITKDMELAEKAKDVAKFADELVTKHVTGTKNVTDSSIDAFQRIVVHMETVANETQTSHDNDQKEIDLLKESIDSCGNAASSELAEIQELAGTISTNRVNHDSCRTLEKSALDEKQMKCDAFQDFADALNPPVCNCENSGSTFTSGPSDDLLKCIQNMLDWSTDAETRYISKRDPCTASIQVHKEKKNACDNEQRVLESSFCSYHQALTTTCSNQEACRSESIEKFNNSIPIILSSQKARKAAYAATEHVRCLVRVLNATEAEQHSLLEECHNMAVDTKHLNIIFPDEPSATPCDTRPVSIKPCDEAWGRNEYSSNTAWHNYSVTHSYVPARPEAANPYEKVSSATCVACAEWHRKKKEEDGEEGDERLTTEETEERFEVAPTPTTTTIPATTRITTTTTTTTTPPKCQNTLGGNCPGCTPHGKGCCDNYYEKGPYNCEWDEDDQRCFTSNVKCVM